MADIINLSAAGRERAGKGAARALRREGRVPAIIYGDKKSPDPISISRHELDQLLKDGTFLTTLFAIDVDGKKTRVIPRDVQYDPVRDFPIHVDFLRLGKGARIAVEVQMNFINEDDSPGLQRGGVLNVVRYAVELECPADAIPDSLDGDLTGLDLGDSLHISDIKLPEDVVPTITDRDFTIATVAAPAGLSSGSDEEGEEGDETAEGEDAAEAEE